MLASEEYAQDPATRVPTAGRSFRVRSSSRTGLSATLSQPASLLSGISPRPVRACTQMTGCSAARGSASLASADGEISVRCCRRGRREGVQLQVWREG